jgi:hypothetical protein
LSTPGIRPRAFSIVPVQSEQCRPPILARIFLRSGLAEGSSLQRSNIDAVAVEAVIEISEKLLPGIRRESDVGRSHRLFASHDPKTPGLLDRVDKLLFLDRFWIEEHAGLPVAV